MMIYDWFFGKENKKNCGNCNPNEQEMAGEFNLLKQRFNDLELDHIELEHINVSLNLENGELKSKNNELISILLKVSDIARVGVECSKKGY